MKTMEDLTNAILNLQLKDVPELQPYFNPDGTLKKPLEIDRTHRPFDINLLPF